MTGTCPEMVTQGSVWDGHKPCGRPVKRNGKCGIHAAAQERATAKATQRAQARVEGDAVADRMTKALGVPVRYRHKGMYGRPEWVIDTSGKYKGMPTS